MFKFLKSFDMPADYYGQEYAEKLMFMITAIGYAVAFIVGFILKDLRYTLILGIATVVFAAVATIPSWPYFRRNPLKFKKAKKPKAE